MSNLFGVKCKCSRKPLLSEIEYRRCFTEWLLFCDFSGLNRFVQDGNKPDWSHSAWVAVQFPDVFKDGPKFMFRMEFIQIQRVQTFNQ